MHRDTFVWRVSEDESLERHFDMLEYYGLEREVQEARASFERDAIPIPPHRKGESFPALVPKNNAPWRILHDARNAEKTVRRILVCAGRSHEDDVTWGDAFHCSAEDMLQRVAAGFPEGFDVSLTGKKGQKPREAIAIAFEGDYDVEMPRILKAIEPLLNPPEQT